MHTRNRKSMGIKVLNLLAAGLLVAALVLGCKPNVSNGGEVQPPVTDGCTITMSAGANGSITASPVIPAGGKVAKDAEITFTATANPGYRVDTWTVTPAEALIADGQQGNTTAKVKITANTTVNVTFKAIKYPVTMTHGEHGDITADMSIPAEGIDYGTEITFTATANPGYRVDTWTITGGTIQAGGQQGNTTAKVKVTANTTVNVTFKPIVYTPVAYADLHNHLTTAQPETNGIYYIEVTGLTAPDVKGNSISNSASPLGQILNSNRQKKVALKFGAIAGVTDMSSCFYGCTKLEHVPNIPDDVTDMTSCFYGCTKLEHVPNIPDDVTDMTSCFYGCTKLEQIPNIPNSVTDMTSCFNGCTKLEQVPNIPNDVTDMKWCFYGCRSLMSVPKIPVGVTDMEKCFVNCTSLTSVTLKCKYLDGKFNHAFRGCSRLSAGSIKVPADLLDGYKDNADKMKAKAEWFAKDE